MKKIYPYGHYLSKTFKIICPVCGMGHLAAVSSLLPTHLCQLATAKLPQDNSTWPTRHRDNLLQVARGKAGQMGKQVSSGQSAECTGAGTREAAAAAGGFPFSHIPPLPPPHHSPQCALHSAHLLGSPSSHPRGARGVKGMSKDVATLGRMSRCAREVWHGDT